MRSFSRSRAGALEVARLWALRVVAPVGIGAAFYAFGRSRPPSLIASLRPEWPTLALPDVLAWALPDALWTFGLTSALLLVWRNGAARVRLAWALAALALAFAHEAAQRLQGVPGTFDRWDLAAQFVGWVVALASAAPATATANGSNRHMAAGAAVAVFSLLAVASAPPQAPDTPLNHATNEDPDALCAATERVFLRKGWGIQSDTCTTEARAVATQGVTFKDLQWAEDNTQTGAFRVIISRGSLEVAVTCSRTEEGRVVETAPCPPQVGDVKKALVDEILVESRSVAGAKRVREQKPSPAATSAGCTKDTDCKGERICSRGECVDPQPAAPPAAPTPQPAAPPAAAPAPAALAPVAPPAVAPAAAP